MNRLFVITSHLLLSIPLAYAANITVDERLGAYQAEGAGPFSAENGKLLWEGKHSAANGDSRSCTSCHGSSLKQGGNHIRTGKPIKAMSPTANPERLTDSKKVEKWFKRNCKWAWGRECTPQEKGDLLRYMQSQ